MTRRALVILINPSSNLKPFKIGLMGYASKCEPKKNMNTYTKNGVEYFRSNFGKIRWIKSKKKITEDQYQQYGLLGFWPHKQLLQVCRTTDFKALREGGFI